MQSLQVLIVDDEPALRQIISKTASRAGHSVSVAASGGEALTDWQKVILMWPSVIFECRI